MLRLDTLGGRADDDDETAVDKPDDRRTTPTTQNNPTLIAKSGTSMNDIPHPSVGPKAAQICLELNWE